MLGRILVVALIAWLPLCCHGDEAVDPDWWKHAVIYQIYPRSFQDSDGDGVGDLQGIISRLDHLVDLGVGAVWLSPIYRSPMADFGYDISDHTDIDPIFGTLDDFDQLLREAHHKGLKVVMDFIPNHTSDAHPWFVQSRAGAASHRDWYVWRPARRAEGEDRLPPNNWLSVFGGPAWTWSEERGMFYLHQFDPAQPDLNYRNRNVVKAMQNVLSFWIKRGVDGFRVDAINTLFENHYDRDEPRSALTDALPTQYDYLDHVYTAHQPEIHGVVRDWRKLFDEWQRRIDKHIFMVMEVYDEALVEPMKYYESGADMPFNFALLFMNASCGGACVTKMVTDWMYRMPEDQWPNWVTGNHDSKRMTTKKGPEFARVMNLLLLMLPGTAVTYQGEEIGMLDAKVSFEQTVDPWGKNFGPELYERFSRDPCRAPMQWNSGANAGFSRAETTWLPVHPDYKTLNVKDQRNDPSGSSVLQVYRGAARLRRRPQFRGTRLTFLVVNDDITSFLRFEPGLDSAYLVALNLGNNTRTENYHVDLLQKTFEAQGLVVLNSGNMNDEDMQVGRPLDLTHVTLDPGQGVVVEVHRREEEQKRKSEL